MQDLTVEKINCAESKILIVGFGEIGQAIFTLFRKEVAERNIFILDPEKHYQFDEKVNASFESVHICIPFTSYAVFRDFLLKFDNTYTYSFMFVHTSINLYTFEEYTSKSNSQRFFFPVRGTHPHIDAGIIKYLNFISPASKTANVALAIENYLSIIFPQSKFEEIKSIQSNILGKLLSTTWYALQIAYANVVKLLSEKDVNFDFDDIYIRYMETDEIGKRYMPTYNVKHECRAVSREKIPRPVMHPGIIEGHCLIQNINKLISSVDMPELTELLRWILKVNNLMK